MKSFISLLFALVFCLTSVFSLSLTANAADNSITAVDANDGKLIYRTSVSGKNEGVLYESSKWDFIYKLTAYDNGHIHIDIQCENSKDNECNEIGSLKFDNTMIAAIGETGYAGVSAFDNHRDSHSKYITSFSDTEIIYTSIYSYYGYHLSGDTLMSFDLYVKENYLTTNQKMVLFQTEIVIPFGNPPIDKDARISELEIRVNELEEQVTNIKNELSKYNKSYTSLENALVNRDIKTISNLNEKKLLYRISINGKNEGTQYYDSKWDFVYALTSYNNGHIHIDVQCKNSHDRECNQIGSIQFNDSMIAAIGETGYAGVSVFDNHRDSHSKYITSFSGTEIIYTSIYSYYGYHLSGDTLMSFDLYVKEEYLTTNQKMNFFGTEIVIPFGNPPVDKDARIAELEARVKELEAQVRELEAELAQYQGVAAATGDINGDGETGIDDATTLQRFIMKLSVPYDEETMKKADIDGDGILTIVDVTFIQRYATKITIPYKIK